MSLVAIDDLKQSDDTAVKRVSEVPPPIQESFRFPCTFCFMLDVRFRRSCGFCGDTRVMNVPL